jgi:NAD-dependent DNA ligase
LSDYELLELLLFRALPRRDVKPLAKNLPAKFGSFAEVIAAPETRLAEVKGVGAAAITELKVVRAAANRPLRGAVKKRPVLSSWSTVLDYCRSAQSFADREQFRFSTSAISLLSMSCSRSARSITRWFIRAKWSSACSNYRRVPLSWCTIIRPAIRRRHRRISR